MRSDLTQLTPGRTRFLRTEIGTGTENGEVSEILDFSKLSFSFSHTFYILYAIFNALF
jgi:hypothetical protein